MNIPLSTEVLNIIIIQKAPETVIHLKVDEEQWRATRMFWYTTHYFNGGPRTWAAKIYSKRNSIIGTIIVMA